MNSDWTVKRTCKVTGEVSEVAADVALSSLSGYYFDPGYALRLGEERGHEVMILQTAGAYYEFRRDGAVSCAS